MRKLLFPQIQFQKKIHSLRPVNWLIFLFWITDISRMYEIYNKWKVNPIDLFLN